MPKSKNNKEKDSSSSSPPTDEKPCRRRQHQQIRAILWHQLRQEWPSLTIGSLAMLGSTAANQALPRLMGRSIDGGGANSTSGSSWKVVVLGGGVASLLRTTLLTRVKGRMGQRLRQAAVHALWIQHDLQWFQQQEQQEVSMDNGETPSTNEKLNAKEEKGNASTTTAIHRTPASILRVLDADVTIMAETWTTAWANLLRSSSAVTYSLYHMWTLDAGLLTLAAALIPAVAGAAVLLRRGVKRTLQQQAILADRAATFVQERLEYLTVVRGADRQATEVLAYQALLDAALAAHDQQALYQGGFMGFCFAAASAAWLAIVHYGGQAVERGRLTHGQLTSFTTYSFLLGLGTSGIVSAMSALTKGWAAAERYQQLVDVPDKKEDAISKAISTSDDASTINQDLVSKVQSISLENVSFAYQLSTNTAVAVLQNLSLTVPRGKVVALVGKNGAGKSTVAHVLAGLYPPTIGRVAVDGEYDLSNLSPAVRSHLIQMVPQTSALFDLSILDNVRYAAPHATMAQVEAALQAANCQALVATKGLDFVVGLHGHKLSGGERQRLSLARALVANPAVLILDEPSAALDTAGETAVTEALTACRATNRGLLLITHQAKRLREADTILVLQQGAIVEQGSYAELSKKPSSVLRQLYPDLSK